VRFPVTAASHSPTNLEAWPGDPVVAVEGWAGPMTELSEHDKYVIKINGLIESGRGDLVEEVAAAYRPGPSGREEFWGARRSGGWLVRTLLDADEPTGTGPPNAAGAVGARLAAELAARWDHRDLLRD
jgi:hypothetical protein